MTRRAQRSGRLDLGIKWKRRIKSRIRKEEVNCVFCINTCLWSFRHNREQESGPCLILIPNIMIWPAAQTSSHHWNLQTSRPGWRPQSHRTKMCLFSHILRSDTAAWCCSLSLCLPYPFSLSLFLWLNADRAAAVNRQHTATGERQTNPEEGLDWIIITQIIQTNLPIFPSCKH